MTRDGLLSGGWRKRPRRPLDGEPGQAAAIAENARGYINLLRDHIDKEDNILYKLAERVLPEEVRPAMVEAYRAAEAKTSELGEKYHRLVEAYEAKTAA